MALGVDLGTTNSSVAWSDAAGDVVSLKVRQGPKEPFDSVERSLVRLFSDGTTPIVGHTAATSTSAIGDSRLVESFKRRFDKARLRQMHLKHEYTATQQYDAVNQCVRYAPSARWVPLEYDDYTLDEIVEAGGLVLRRLLTATEIDPDPLPLTPGRSVLDRVLGRQPDAAASDGAGHAQVETAEQLYIGVPVTFGPTGRRRLLRALVASGCFGDAPDAYRTVLERCRFVYEPLALAATAQLFESQNLLVVDYGGGTLDVALLRVDLDGSDRHVKQLAVGGVPRAGDVLDEVFRDHLLEEMPGLRAAYERQIATGDEDRRNANGAFGNAKVELSTHDAASMLLFGGVDVLREDLERAIGPEIDNAVVEIQTTLVRGGLRPVEVGAVVLTGGSSLVPLFKNRVRERFEHLDDLAFDAGSADEIESARRTLTGVSRGLARFGFLESLETSAPSTFGIVVPGTHNSPVTVLERGVSDTHPLEQSPQVYVEVAPGRHSFALYSDLLQTTYCGGLADVDMPPGAQFVEIRASAARSRFVPAFSVSVAGVELCRFDLESMSAVQLRSWAESDSDWLPADVKCPSKPFLVRPLQLGDFVEWRRNGHLRRGKIVKIRDLGSDLSVEQMVGVDPAAYSIEAALESDRVVRFGHIARPNWEVGDVRLA